MSLAAAVLASALGGSTAIASPAGHGQTVFVDPAVVLTVDIPKGINAYISPPIVPVTFSGLWHIPPGSYTIRREAHADGRRFALIPWTRRQPNEDIILENKKDPSGCRSVVQHFAAIDIQTQELQHKTWIFTRSNCDIGDRWDQRFWLARSFRWDEYQVRQESAAIVAERKSETEREARLVEEREHAVRRSRLEQHEAMAQAEAPAKRQIGATVCSVRAGMGYAGYTEQVSPDINRIRIRVVRHFAPDSGRFLLNVPREEHLWDHPDNWYLCNF